MTPTHVIDLGCKVADVHHRYQEIHSALFGAASFRLIIDALRGSRQRAHHHYVQRLNGLGDELAALEAEIAAVELMDNGRVIERQLRDVLLAYTQVLHKVVARLTTVFEGLRRDESAYREPGPDRRSEFTRDKLQYDHLLLEMERLGTRLNRLFANY